MKNQNKCIFDEWKLIKKTGFITLKEIQGTIIRVKYIKIIYENLFLYILYKLGIYYEYKEIIYWNPYKSTISESIKYSEIGPKSRGKHAKIWFEIDPKDEIYTKFTDKFLYNFTLPIPFPGIYLTPVTSKRLKSTLDDILYHK